MRDRLRSAAAGFVGGLVGSTVMVWANHLTARAGIGADDRGRHDQARRRDAEPNDTDSTISDEPASMKAASRLSEAVTGRALGTEGKNVAGPVLHHLFGAGVGAAYGAIAAGLPAVSAGAGAPFGVAVWIAAAEIGLPLSGLARPPWSYPASRHLASLLSHIVFGMTVEAVRRAATHATIR